MKHIAFFCAIMAFALAGMEVNGWGWFLAASVVLGVFA